MESDALAGDINRTRRTEITKNSKHFLFLILIPPVYKKDSDCMDNNNAQRLRLDKRRKNI